MLKHHKLPLDFIMQCKSRLPQARSKTNINRNSWMWK